MRIILDIMSGDRAPLETLRGAVDAKKENYSEGGDFTLVGDEKVIRKTAEENHLDISGFEIVHTDVTLDMHDEPMSVMKEKKDSSLSRGLNMLAKGEGDAFVSCGNTGALFCGSTLILKRVKGVQRAAIGAIMPLTKPFMLMDSGASVKVNEDYLHMFGVMGTAYMKAIYGIENPTVAMINNGAEEHKGGELQLAAYELLKNAPVNFIGNVEARDLMSGVCDVVVADGFSGNVALKMAEGVASSVMKMIKGVFYKNVITKIAALLVLPHMKSVKETMDYKKIGGAPVIGVKKPVFKAHGNSDAEAFKSAIGLAKASVENNFIEKLENNLKTAGKAEEE